MNICIPVTRDEGFDSPLSPHFGSAPCFLVVDAESGTCRAVANANAHHAHGMCQPLHALAGQPFEAAIVGGIGAGALGRLQAAGVRVFLARARTAGEALATYRAGDLPEMSPALACGGHGQARGHGHDQAHGPGHGHGEHHGGPHGCGRARSGGAEGSGRS